MDLSEKMVKSEGRLLKEDCQLLCDENMVVEVPDIDDIVGNVERKTAAEKDSNANSHG